MQEWKVTTSCALEGRRSTTRRSLAEVFDAPAVLKRNEASGKRAGPRVQRSQRGADHSTNSSRVLLLVVHFFATPAASPSSAPFDFRSVPSFFRRHRRYPTFFFLPHSRGAVHRHASDLRGIFPGAIAEKGLAPAKLARATVGPRERQRVTPTQC